MQFLLDPESQDVHVNLSTNEHEHPVTSGTSKLNRESKERVLELLELGVSQPRKLLRELEKGGLPKLTKVQINNLKSRTSLKVRGCT